MLRNRVTPEIRMPYRPPISDKASKMVYPVLSIRVKSGCIAIIIPYTRSFSVMAGSNFFSSSLKRLLSDNSVISSMLNGMSCKTISDLLISYLDLFYQLPMLMASK